MRSRFAIAAAGLGVTAAPWDGRCALDGGPVAANFVVEVCGHAAD